MQKATPVQLRTSMDLALKMQKAGLRFVSIPVFNDDDFSKMMLEVGRRIDEIITSNSRNEEPK